MDLEVSHLRWCHTKVDKVPGERVHTDKIHQAQIASELLMTANPFIVIKKITAAIKDRLFPVYFYCLYVVRRMPVNNVNLGTIDQAVGKINLPRRNRVSPITSPVD